MIPAQVPMPMGLTPLTPKSGGRARLSSFSWTACAERKPLRTSSIRRETSCSLSRPAPARRRMPVPSSGLAIMSCLAPSHGRAVRPYKSQRQRIHSHVQVSSYRGTGSRWHSLQRLYGRRCVVRPAGLPGPKRGRGAGLISPGPSVCRRGSRSPAQLWNGIVLLEVAHPAEQSRAGRSMRTL